VTERRFVFVVNPRSAAGATLRRFESVRERFRARLGAAGASLDVKLTNGPRHATVLAREAVASGAAAVVAVGGDGTNNEVVNGFFDERGERLASDTALGVVTSGTGGDFRRTFGWGTDPLDDLERLALFNKRRIDVGRLRCVDDAGMQVVRFFVNVSSFGLSGVAVDVVNNSSKRLGAKLSFMIGSAKTMATYKPQHVKLALDDGPAVEEDITLVAVANGQYFGGGMWIAPDAVVDDGRFDVVAVRGGGLGFWVTSGLKLYSGGHRHLPEVKITRCAKVTASPATAGEQVFIELDGEQPGVLPATWDVVPGAIELLV
jgi:YegS/Rv2252/BmrU family lipid kinase